jgi:hypothetical protein
LFAYRADADPDPYLAWHSTQAASPGRNVSSLSDVRFDRLLEEARQTPAPARRVDLYRDFQELFAQELPAIPLFASTSVYVQETTVKESGPPSENPGAASGRCKTGTCARADAPARYAGLREWNGRRWIVNWRLPGEIYLGHEYSRKTNSEELLQAIPASHSFVQTI